MAFQNLDGHQYMSLTTFRKDGTPVPTPVWFAQVGATLYVITQDNSGKVKRIRNNGGVTVAPCTASGEVLGESAEGTARLIPVNTPEAKTADDALNKKYGLLKHLFALFQRVMSVFGRNREGGNIYLAITP